MLLFLCIIVIEMKATTHILYKKQRWYLNSNLPKLHISIGVPYAKPNITSGER